MKVRWLPSPPISLNLEKVNRSIGVPVSGQVMVWSGCSFPWASGRSKGRRISMLARRARRNMAVCLTQTVYWMQRVILLVANVGEQALNFFLSFPSERQKRQPCRPAEVAVEIHAILHAGNAKVTNHPLRGQSDPLLLQPRQVDVTLFPCSINFVTRRWRKTGEGQNRSHRSGIERRMQLMRRPHQHLESRFLWSLQHFAHHRDCLGRRLRRRQRRRRARQHSDLHQFSAL